MSTEAQKTLGEWTINSAESLYHDIGIKSPLIKDGKPQKYGYSFKQIARLRYDAEPNHEKHISSREAEANAKYICTAVNNHSSLLNALKGMVNDFSRDFPALAGSGLHEPYNTALAAIKATEKQQ